jgi:LuxR family transcriptional regulator, regulator of acetate metabolism
VSAPTAEQGEIATALRELRQVQRELVERDLVRRSDALDKVKEAVERLAEIGSSAGILERAAETLGAGSSFERVLVSQVDGDLLLPRSAWTRTGSAADIRERLERVEIALRYPLAESEIAQRGGDAVEVAADGPRSPAELRALFGWTSYVVAPMRLRGGTIGLLHAEPALDDRLGGRVHEREVAGIYAKGLAAAFERAALRETILRHRGELRAAMAWMRDYLEEERLGLGAEPDRRPPAADAEPLTPRETEVIELLRRGQTTAAISASLLISESTVKFHVKNILLKLGATSRAEAVARHLRGGP